MAGRWQVAVGRLHLEIGRCELAWWQLEAGRIYLVRGSLRLADGCCWWKAATGPWSVRLGRFLFAGPTWWVAGGRWQLAGGTLKLAGASWLAGSLELERPTLCVAA